MNQLVEVPDPQDWVQDPTAWAALQAQLESTHGIVRDLLNRMVDQIAQSMGEATMFEGSQEFTGDDFIRLFQMIHQAIWAAGGGQGSGMHDLLEEVTSRAAQLSAGGAVTSDWQPSAGFERTVEACVMLFYTHPRTTRDVMEREVRVLTTAARFRERRMKRAFLNWATDEALMASVYGPEGRGMAREVRWWGAQGVADAADAAATPLPPSPPGR